MPHVKIQTLANAGLGAEVTIEAEFNAARSSDALTALDEAYAEARYRIEAGSRARETARKRHLNRSARSSAYSRITLRS